VQQTTVQARPEPYVVDASAVPKTAQEVQAIRIKLDDLRSELQDAASRRRTISEQLRGADNRAAKGLEDRMQVLDSRIVQIEKDITANGVLLRNAPSAALIAGTSQDPDPNVIIDKISEKIIPIVFIVSVFIFAPFAIAVSRFLWRRSTTTTTRAALPDAETQRRLEQLQQSVDTIALEVERISEGQRFVTKVMSERERLPISTGRS
jgi:chaperonin cofactor prefoldin